MDKLKNEDPVVREFKVVVLHDSPISEGEGEYVDERRNAYVVQYPTLVKYLPLQRVENVVFQPKHEKLETAISTLQTHTDQQSVFKSVNKTTFRSKKIPTRAQYAVGSFSHNCLVLRPVKAVLQMQPVFDYIDKPRVQQESLRLKTAKVAKEEALAAQNRILGTSYKVRETFRARNRKLRSFAHMKTLEGNDSKLNLNIIRHADPIGASYRQTFAEENNATVDRETFMTADEYCQHMCMTEKIEGETESFHSNDKLNRLALKELPVADRVKEIVRCGHVVSHADLMQLACHHEADIPEKKIATLVLDAAYLVQGYWVAHSRLWYKVGYHIACRDYILKKFELGDTVSYKAIASLMLDLSPTLLDIILREIGVFDPKKCVWKFKYPCDKKIMQLFGDIAIGTKKLRNLADCTNQIQLGLTTSTANKSTYWGSSAGSQRTKRGQNSGAFSTRKPDKVNQLNTPLTAIGSAVYQVLEDHGICTMQLIVETVKLSQNNDSLPSQQIQDEVIRLCHSVRGRYILRDTDDPQFDNWRNIVVNLFKKNEFIRRKDVRQAIETVTGSSIPAKSFRKVMTSIARTGDKGHKGLWSLLRGNLKK